MHFLLVTHSAESPTPAMHFLLMTHFCITCYSFNALPPGDSVLQNLPLLEYMFQLHINMVGFTDD